MTTLAGIVAASAARTPDADALVGLDSRFTWAEVDQAVGAVAAALVTDGVAPGDRVAVMRLKDAASFIAVHAILRAGAVAVPVDPLAPHDVARALLADAEVSAVIGDTRTVTTAAVEGMDLRSVIVDGDEPAPGWRSWSETLDASAEVVLPSVQCSDRAYIVYTSGSTGRPKGIVHTHASGMAYAQRAASSHGLTAADRVAGIAPLHFDQATFELFAAPLVGAAVVVMGEAHSRFPAALVERSEAERVSVWYSVPSLFRQLAERGGMDQRDLSALRLIKYGGEVFPSGALNALHDLVPHAAVTNVYGPAEVNECTNQPMALPLADDADTPIGRPWVGVDVRIVDDTGADVADGVAGELLVAGPTMMQGYWGRDDLTEASMRCTEDGTRWYATGDMVTRDGDGLLWFHGRRDNQVKVRGVRIELEAVEAVLADAPGVLEAVVVVVDDGQALEATIVEAAERPDDLELRRWCAKRLAQVAVPRAFRRVDGLPTTPSGKIDRSSVRAEMTQEPA